MKCRALLVLATLGGCSQAVTYERPGSVAEITGPAYPAELRGDGVGRAAVDIPWREFFADPRLQVLIAQALESNRDLVVATARIDEARAQYRIVRADLLPTVDARASARYGGTIGGGGGGGGSSGSTNNAGTNNGGSGNGGTNNGGTGTTPVTPTDPTTPTTPGDTGTTGGSTGGGGGRYQVAAVASYELDFWGRVRSLDRAARALYLQTIEAQRAFRLTLIADVAEAHLIDRELAERIALATVAVRSREQSLRIATRLFEEGEGSRLEIEQERSLLTDAQAQRADLQRLELQNRNLLALLVGRPLEATLPPPRPLAGQGIIATIPAGLPSDLLNNRPDIIASEQGLRAATADVGAARAAFFPRIALTGSLGLSSDSLTGLFSGGPIWSFVPSLVQPIFDGGANRGNLDIAVARRNIAVAQYERTVQVAFREVADALAGRRYLADQRRAQEARLAALRSRLRLIELRFTEGFSAIIDVLDARREIFAAEQQLVQSRRAELSNAVALYAALGGGLP